jgi:hypothetical protein
MDPQHAAPGGEPPQPAPAPGSTSKRKWVSPEVIELPRLTDLTLQTGAPIPGFGDPGSGSTVF